MAQSVNGELLLVQLQLRAPGGRTFLIASTDASDGAFETAQALDTAIKATGSTSRLIDLTKAPAIERLLMGAGASVDESSKVNLGASTRTALSAFDGFTVVAAPSVLDSTAGLLAAASVDGIVVVARVGRTQREQLGRLRDEVSALGGKVVGAVLI